MLSGQCLTLYLQYAYMIIIHYNIHVISIKILTTYQWDVLSTNGNGVPFQLTAMGCPFQKWRWGALHTNIHCH